ncbi:MAG: IS200/IS605 family element transposase accessory protein TnpB, partial [Candidatus Helarchaeota archaeon]|nr:IS200/IS605 family element transposase accessory protein TnpB [Candidatus Helarchaeota archaeon]
MLTTTIFRLHPSESQIPQLNEIFTVYNRMKRKGYQLVFHGASRIQQTLMQVCQNNPYVNTILTENKTKLEQQKTWLKKRATNLTQKLEVVEQQIAKNIAKSPNDRSLPGLYSKRSSLQNRLAALALKPVVFGTKQLFRQRIRGRIAREEFLLRRDASFRCDGKVQDGVQNNNLKILPSKELRISTFHKTQGRIPKRIRVPLAVNPAQRATFQALLQLDKYTVVVKRKLVKGEVRYYAHVSYDTPEPDLLHRFRHGAIGMDFNYNFVTLVNIDKAGQFLSYQQIPFRNLHSYRKGRRDDYASFKLDKVINYCINKGKGLIIEDLSFAQSFSYNKKRNRKLNQFKTSMLPLLERKCARHGIAVRKVHPAYTTIIGALKYSWSFNFSDHVLASYVIARRGLGFAEPLPACYKRLLAQVGGVLKPRLNPSSPYYQWAQLYDLFKHYGVTPFRSPDPTTNLKRNLLVALDTVLDGLNPATGVPPDNLRA